MSVHQNVNPSCSASFVPTKEALAMHQTRDPQRWTQTRSQIANILKADPDADVTDLRRKLKAELLADYVRRTVDGLFVGATKAGEEADKP